MNYGVRSACDIRQTPILRTSYRDPAEVIGKFQRPGRLTDFLSVVGSNIALSGAV
jgi:hypothetical protein